MGQGVIYYCSNVESEKIGWDVIAYHLSDSVFLKMSRQIRIIVEQKMEKVSLRDGKLSRDEDCFIIKVSQSSDVFSQLFPTQFIKLRNMLRKTF